MADALGELRWDMSKLGESMDAWAKAFHLELAEAVKLTAFRLEARLKSHPGGTPRDTGRAANSWHVVVFGGSPAYAYRDNRGRSFDGSTSQTPARDTQALVSTNVEYMLALENGWSKQAPAGFIRRHAKEMRREFLDAVIAAKAKASAKAK